MGDDCSGEEGERRDRLPHLDGCGMQTSGKSLSSGSQEVRRGAIEVSPYCLYLGCLLLGN